MRYRAFISYSHAADGRLAPALQSGLHRLRGRGTNCVRLAVFRDNTDLSASPGLWSGIKQALEQSDYFLLMASPEAARSKWVRREVEFWRQKRSHETIILVLTDGEMLWDEHVGDFDWTSTISLPQVLAGLFPEEPYIPDLAGLGLEEDLSLANPRFRDLVATLAAKLHGRPKNELIGEDVREHRRTMRLARSAVAALTMLTIAALGAAWYAFQQRGEALRQAQIALVRQLNAQAELARDSQPDLLPLSTLLAIESIRRSPSPEAESVFTGGSGPAARKVAHLPLQAVDSVRFSFDGQLLVARSADDRLVVRKTRTGEVLAEWKAGEAVEARFNRDGTHLAVLGAASAFPYTEEEHHALVREISTGTTIARVPYRGGLQGVLLSSDARYLAFSRYEVVRLWDIAKGEEALRRTHEGSVNSFEFAPEGESVAVATSQGFYLWSTADGRQLLHEGPGEVSRRGVSW